MKILQIALKDLKHTFQNLFSLVMMLGAPLLVTGLLYFAFGGLASGGEFQLPAAEVMVVNLDQESGNSAGFSASKMLLNFLEDEEIESVLSFTPAEDPEKAREAVQQGVGEIVLIIPADFTEAALQPGKRSEIILFHDPTLSIGPGILEDLLIHFLDGFSGAKIAADVVDWQLSSRGLGDNQNLAGTISGQYAAWLETAGHSEQASDPVGINLTRIGSGTPENPAAELIGPIMSGMMIFFVFFMAANGAQSVIQEQERGTLPRLVTTPTPPSQILAGKFLGVFLVVVIQVVLLLGASNMIFGIQWGKPLPVSAVALAMLTAATGFGILVISFLKNTRQTGPVLGGVLTLTGMLGGLFTNGIPNLPPAFETVRLIMPQGWAMAAWELTLRGSDLEGVIFHVLVLLGLGAAFFGLGTWIFRRRFV